MCLRLLHQLEQDGQVNLVIVVNNGEGDRVCYSNVPRNGFKVIISDFAKNVGFAAAANKGIRKGLDSGANAVLLLNPDLEIFPGAVASMVSCLKSERGLLIVIPPARSGESGNARRGTTRFSAAYAWLMPRETIERVGLFDTDFFFGREDTDYCIRLSLKGGRIVREAKARIVHLLEQGSPIDAGTLRIRAYHMMRGRILLMRKHSVSRVGLRFHIGQIVGIFRDLLSMSARYRSIECLLWQLGGLVPGSTWPVND
jgi:rhamnosyltransferase